MSIEDVLSVRTHFHYSRYADDVTQVQKFMYCKDCVRKNIDEDTKHLTYHSLELNTCSSTDA